MVCVICILCLRHLCCLSQMHFKYAHKGENESEKFEIGVVLARQFLGKGPWEVWDLRPGCEKWCKSCSSSEERLVRHNGGRCPKALTRRQLGDQRAASTQKAIAERACLDNLQSASALAAELEDKRDDQIDQVGASPARPVPEKGASSGEEEARESGCSDARTGEDVDEAPCGKEEAGGGVGGAGDPGGEEEVRGEGGAVDLKAVHDRLILEYVAANGKYPGDGPWYTLREKAQQELDSMTIIGKRRRVHTRFHPGIVPTGLWHGNDSPQRQKSRGRARRERPRSRRF